MFRAVSEQVRARFMEAFRWRRGDWAFIRGAHSEEEVYPMSEDPYEILRDVAFSTHHAEIESVLAPHFERVVVRDRTGPSVDSFRLPQDAQRLVDSIKGDATLGGLIGEISKSGADVETAYRTFYLGVASGFLRTSPTRSDGAFISN
ncbi:MAG: hypothetical protein R3A47_02950 [Polyangiales bacterium]